jgi:hypothetical protein
MNFNSEKYKLLFYICISFILLISIMKWINYLTKNNYIIEYFTNGPINESGATSHTVNLPLTTQHSCKNFCGPTARCSVTGQQCLSDIDCSGCQPYSPPLPKTSASVPAANDAGKLTFGPTPQYSPLTSGYGTHELVITKNMYEKPLSPNFGVDIWTKDFEESKKLFDQRYKPPQLSYMPDYPKRYSLSGEFIEDGPFPSNAPLPKR